MHRRLLSPFIAVISVFPLSSQTPPGLMNQMHRAGEQQMLQMQRQQAEMHMQSLQRAAAARLAARRAQESAMAARNNPVKPLPPLPLPTKQAWLGSTFLDVAIQSGLDGTSLIAYSKEYGRLKVLDRFSGKVRWESTLEPWLHLEPQQVGDQIFYVRKNGQGVVLEAATGKQLCTVALETYDSFFISSRVAHPRVLPPLLMAGRLVVAVYGKGKASGKAEGMVQAFDPVSGAKAWELAIPGGPDLMPMAHGNRLLVGGDGQVMALDPATGKVEWTAKLGKGGGSSEFGLGFLDRNRLVLICEQSRIALDVDSGQELWRQEVGPIRASILTGEGDRFILLESRGKISTSTWMVALDALTGRKAWERKLGNSAFPWAESGVVYCFEKDALLCLDLKEGKPLWQLPFSVPSDPLVSVAINSPILPGDGVMYVAVELSKDQTDSFGTTTTETSLLKAVALKDGKELWSYPLAVPYAQGYILADERGLVYNGIGKKLVRVE